MKELRISNSRRGIVDIAARLGCVYVYVVHACVCECMRAFVRWCVCLFIPALFVNDQGSGAVANKQRFLHK